MGTEAIIFMLLRAIQIGVLAWASVMLFRHGRELLPSVFEPMAAFGVIQYVRVILVLPEEFSRSFTPSLNDWSLLGYDLLLPLLIGRHLNCELSRKRNAWSAHRYY